MIYTSQRLIIALGDNLTWILNICTQELLLSSFIIKTLLRSSQDSSLNILSTLLALLGFIVNNCGRVMINNHSIQSGVYQMSLVPLKVV